MVNNNKYGANQNIHDPTWTEQRINRLMQLFADGFRASAIAAELGGITRNAVIGKVHRLGLTRSFSYDDLRARVARGRREAKERRTAQLRAAEPCADLARAIPSVPLPDEPLSPLDTKHKCSLFDLTNRSCRFPIGEPGTPDFHFCGYPTADLEKHQPYCPHHARIAFTPASRLPFIPRPRGWHLDALEIEP